MARMPDGWVFFVESDNLGTKVQMKGSRELVMCKNCKYYGEEAGGDVMMYYCGLGYTRPYDYCSMGERRDDE